MDGKNKYYPNVPEYKDSNYVKSIIDGLNDNLNYWNQKIKELSESVDNDNCELLYLNDKSKIRSIELERDKKLIEIYELEEWINFKERTKQWFIDKIINMLDKKDDKNEYDVIIRSIRMKR